MQEQKEACHCSMWVGFGYRARFTGTALPTYSWVQRHTATQQTFANGTEKYNVDMKVTEFAMETYSFSICQPDARYMDTACAASIIIPYYPRKKQKLPYMHTAENGSVLVN